MNFYKLGISFFLISIFLSNVAFAQNGSISIENNFSQPNCISCTTLHATTTPITGIGGTGSYTVVQNAYNPYPYVGTTFLTSAANFGGIIDDQWSNVLNLPFSFCFFNNTYNQYLVSLNGQIGFDLSNALQSNTYSLATTPLPNNNLDLNNTIMGAYYDIYPFVGTSPTSSITTATYGVAPNRAFVLSFNENPMFSCTSTFITQQIVLHEGSNIIDVNIKNKSACTNWTSGNNALEGIQNSTGTIAFTVPGRNSGTWTATNDSYSFVPQGGVIGGGINPTSIDWYSLPNNTYLGSGDTIQVCPNSSQRYYAKATYDLCGSQLFLYDTVLITKQQPITFTINSITNANCFDESTGAINCNANGGSNSFTYTTNGNPSSNNPTGLHANTYTIVAIDAFNCTASTTVTVGEPTKVSLNSTLLEDVLCKYQNNGKIHLLSSGGTPPYLYLTGNGTPQNFPEFDTLYAGSYQFYTADARGCLDSIQLEVKQPDSLLTVDLVTTIATCLNKKDGTIAAFSSGGNSSFYAYEWTNTNPIQTAQTAIGLASGAYNVVVTDANNCITASQIQLEQELCCQLFMPDAFTPNGDLRNDVYSIIERGGGVILGEFRIYNRYGQVVFSTSDINKGWDGTFKGKDQNSDTYFYILQYQCNDKGIISPKVAKGSIILIR
jgi:gliding motility-associated-like protein